MAARISTPAVAEPIDEALKNIRPPSERIDLESNGGKIPAIYMEETTGVKQGAVVIVHDLDMNPDWPEIITPLRTRLPESGWTTLSISPDTLRKATPPESADAFFADTGAAIGSAIKVLQGKGYENLAIIGVGYGAVAAAAFIAADPGGADAFIGINMDSDTANDPKLLCAQYLEKISLPILDIYGELAPKSVHLSAPSRALAAKRSGATAKATQNLEPFKQSAVAQSPFANESGFIAYRQVVVAGAGTAFLGAEGPFLKRIIGWLRRHATGATVTR